MKQIEKLQDLIKSPKNYGVKKGTRVYRMICEAYIYGVVRTGYSDKNTKYIETYGVYNALTSAGVSCKRYNDAPRGGACGEHVALIGKVLNDCKKSFHDFEQAWKAQNPKKNVFSYDCEIAYLAKL